MVDVNLFPLDLVMFRDWLIVQQQAGALVGVACDGTACPLSRFLSFLYGGSWLVYGVVYERLDAIDACFELPEWAEEFAAIVDWVESEGKPLSASAALQCLQQACRECGMSVEGRAYTW